MKSLIWDYKAKKLLDCQELKLDINLNPQIAFGIHLHRGTQEFCQLEFTLDYSYFPWIQEWIDQSSYNSRTIDYKRDLHLNNDIVFKGCVPKLIDLNPDPKYQQETGDIKLIIQCDHYHPLLFREILEVHRDLMIGEILSN